MPDNKRTLAVIAIILTTFFWGVSFSSTKVLLDSLVPEQIAFFRLILAVLALGAIFLFTRQKLAAKKDLLRMAAGGLTGMFLYFLLEFNGLRFTTAGTGALIVAIIPVLNVIAGALFFKERSTYKGWLGVFLSFFGVYLVINFGASGILSLESLRGNILVFLAACTWVAFTRINEPLVKNYGTIAVNFQQALVGSFFLSFLALPRGVELTVFTPSVLLNLAYLGLLCSAAAYLFYMYALNNLGSTTVTTYLNLVPVFGVLGGALFLGEALAAGQIIGAATVIFGVTLVTSARPQPEKVPQGDGVHGTLPK